MKGLFVTATGTDVGKTFVSAGIMTALMAKAGKACYYKPVESGGIPEGDRFVSGDGRTVSRMSDCKEIYNTYCFEHPMSPHLAARVEDAAIDVSRIKADYTKLCEAFDFVLVEGAGGLMVPLTGYDYTVADLIGHLDLACIIVADAGLGTINHTVLTVEACQRRGLAVKGIILNHYKGTVIQEENVKALEAMTGTPVLACIPSLKAEADFRHYFENHFDIDPIMGV